MSRLLPIAFCAAVILIPGLLRAHDTGSSLAVNFGANDNGSTAGRTLAPTDKAGAVPQANWNNANGASGSAASLTIDSSGAAQSSAVSISWSSPNTWSSTGRGEENNGFPPGGDRVLMTGYLDTSDTSAGNATVTVSGLGPEFTAHGYDLLVYCVGGVANRGGAYTVGSTTKFGTAPDNPSAHVEDPGLDLSDTGTYVRFSGLHDASFTLTTSADGTVYPGHVNFRAPINGIQIVAAPEFDFSGWFALPAGVGESSGGDFALISTIGQPIVGGMNGGDYALESGFLNIVVALRPGEPPVLRIALTIANSVMISWPAPAPGWVLQHSSTLGPSASWTDVGAPVIANGADNTVTQPMSAGNRFYRLSHP